MKIFYDGGIYPLYLKQSGGICRYFDNLISRLPKDFHPILTSTRSRSDRHPEHPNLKLFNYKRYGFKPGRVSYWIEAYYFQAVEAFNNYQISHPTYYSLLTRRKFEKKICPVVLTVHDMIHEIFANSMDPNGETSAIKRKAILAADFILCISESTKIDLLERYPSLEDRLIVTLLATEFNEGYINENAFIPARPYYLYIGGRGGYKNFDRLLLAFAQIIPKFPDLILCVVGSLFTKEEHKRIAELNLTQNIEHYGVASDGQLAKLYKSSIAFVYPSLYEGFGIPPLEAMSCGTAVIASNTSSIPEVVGDAGLLFDPTSTDELIDRLLFLLEYPSQRDFLISKGKQQVQKFSWEKTAMQTVNVYRSLT